MLTKDSYRLTHEGAQVVLQAAAKKAAEMKLPICIAIVDDGGYLVAFARIDDARPSSVSVAVSKAVSAATRRSPSGPYPSVEKMSLTLSIGLPLASNGLLSCIRGGIPLEWKGTVIGAIGISAGTEDQDEEVARAGVAALKSQS